MPGSGRLVDRDYTSEERTALEAGATALGLASEKMYALLGNTTRDIYLSSTVYWSNIPIHVWAFTVGGYQVIKKWLSYREQGVLGRALQGDEARYITHTSRRIAALILLGPALDRNYDALKAATYEWKPASSPHTTQSLL